MELEIIMLKEPNGNSQTTQAIAKAIDYPQQTDILKIIPTGLTEYWGSMPCSTLISEVSAVDWDKHKDLQLDDTWRIWETLKHSVRNGIFP